MSSKHSLTADVKNKSDKSDGWQRQMLKMQIQGSYDTPYLPICWSATSR